MERFYKYNRTHAAYDNAIVCDPEDGSTRTIFGYNSEERFRRNYQPMTSKEKKKFFGIREAATKAFRLWADWGQGKTYIGDSGSVPLFNPPHCPVCGEDGDIRKCVWECSVCGTVIKTIPHKTEKKERCETILGPKIEVIQK